METFSPWLLISGREHDKLVDRETTTRKQHPTLLMAKSCCHLVGAALDSSGESLDRIIGAKRFM